MQIINILKLWGKNNNLSANTRKTTVHIYISIYKELKNGHIDKIIKYKSYTGISVTALTKNNLVFQLFTGKIFMNVKIAIQDAKIV